jgi:hypothetical protein
VGDQSRGLRTVKLAVNVASAPAATRCVPSSAVCDPKCPVSEMGRALRVALRITALISTFASQVAQRSVGRTSTCAKSAVSTRRR